MYRLDLDLDGATLPFPKLHPPTNSDPPNCVREALHFQSDYYPDLIKCHSDDSENESLLIITVSTAAHVAYYFVGMSYVRHGHNLCILRGLFTYLVILRYYLEAMTSYLENASLFFFL